MITFCNKLSWMRSGQKSYGISLESLKMALSNIDTSDPQTNFKLLENLLSDVNGVQQQVLKEIVTGNAHTEYLKSFLNLEGTFDADLYRKKVPVVDYEHIEGCIEKIVNGDASKILLAQPILELIRSSGTSGGQSKLIPTTAEDLDRKITFENLVSGVLCKHIEGLDQGKMMDFIFIKPEFKTPAGLNIASAITNLYKSTSYRNRPFNRFNVNTSPDDILLCPDIKQSMYCQLLCGLVQRDDVVMVGSVFAFSLLKVIKEFEDQWQELCSNIRTGCLSDWITDSNCRNALASILSEPMPDLAAAIEQECRRESWEGIVQRVWLKTKFVKAIFTGSMAQYIPMVEFYCGRSLPLVSTYYASSEGYFGINLKPLCKPCDILYTFVPTMAYYEFLPFHKTEELGKDNVAEQQNYANDEVVDLGNVKIGQHYELVLTTYTGLYRYKIGDVFACTDFLNNVPQFRFVQRKNSLLSISTEKTSEEDLQKSITEALHLIEPLGFMLVDYTSCVDTSDFPGHYVLFWELQMIKRQTKSELELELELDSALMEQCCSVVEQSLDHVYREFRNVGKEIGPLEIRAVKNGTFDELTDHFLSLGASLVQYKTPRCVKSEKIIEMLNSKVVGKFFSKKLPSWRPELERKKSGQAPTD